MGSRLLVAVSGVILGGRQMFRQVPHVDGIAFAHHAGMGEDVLQFAHVAGPGVARQQDLGARGDAADRFAVLGGHALDEVALEQRQILLALGQSRQFELDHRQPVEQVFPELLAFDHLAQIAVGGGHHADIGFARGGRTDALELPGFEHAQAAWSG